MNKNINYLSLFIALMFIAGGFLAFAGTVEAIDATRTWYGSPENIRAFYNEMAAQKGYTQISTAWIGQEMVSNDAVTAQKICEWAGYSTVSSRACYEYGTSGRCNFTSCGDNSLAKWNGSNTTIFNSCGGTWLASLTCSNPVTAPVVCSNSSQCGTNGYTGSNFCQGGNVYKNYTTYTCNNAGTSSSNCTNSLSAQLQTTCSALQTCSNGACENTVTPVCSSNSNCGTNGYIGDLFCQNGNVYRNYRTYTCNNAGTSTSSGSNSIEARLQQTCSSNQACSNGSCVQEDEGDCDSNSDCGTNGYTGDEFCYNGDVYRNYRTYTCRNAGTSTSYCSNNTERHLADNCDSNEVCNNGNCEDNNNNCTSNNCNCTNNSYQQCSGSYLYWYSSCGVRGNVAQYCDNGCYNNSCQNNNTSNCNNNNNNNNCVNFSYKQCVGNNIYWYNSCGQQTDLYQTCYGSNACQAGVCVTTQPIQPTYISHYRTSCYGNSVYWYDSLGGVNSVYKNCVDANSCTIDTCSGSACANTLKCDGTTCATSSADYNTYCKSGQGTGTSNILFSLFAKKDANAVQWDKSVEIRSNETSYFLITVENNSQENIQSAKVLASIPAEITSLGNLKVNDVAVSGDIVSGIEVGPLASGVLKRVTFEGKSGTISFPSTKQVNAKVDFNGISQPDILSINFSTAQVAGAVSEAKSSIWIVEFLKRWYLWILGFLVLIFLFVVIFRRLSSN